VTDAVARLAGALAGRYRIERELGAGGMATVYLAHDVRHDRKVALKVLRPELSAILGGERFLAEIKTTANLQHPHILSLFDSGEADGLVFYVMPYVEGESLRDRLTREKQLPVEEAVAIAREVADALSYAHQHGVVHRDIKPENILLHGGHAMVADFGIALAASRSEGGTRLTETGMSLGTPHYMSPEQAMGEREITPKADIYALGCVLYEMLTAEPPFTGATAQAIIARVMTEEPRSLTLQRKTIPPHVEAAVLTALQKLPADRYPSARDFGDALGDARIAAARTGRRAAATASSGGALARRPLFAALTLGAVLLVAALTGWLRPRAAPETSRQRVVLWQYPLGQLLDPGVAREATQAAIAPDGSSIVYADSTGGRLHLMRKLRSAAAATPLAGTEGALSPFFSPDGRWIGFSTEDGSLKKVPVEGGGAVTLARRSDPTYTAAAWLDDGTIVYGGKVGLNLVSAEGGPSRLLLPDTARARATALTISPLPGGRGVLYTQCPDNCALRSDVRVLDLKTLSDRMLVENAAGAWYAPTGHLLYTDRAGGLYAAGFDPAGLRLTTGPAPVIDDVVPGSVAMSATGTMLYSTTAGGGSLAELVLVSRDGSAASLDSTWRADFQYPALSPDGTQLAVSLREATTQLWIRRSDGTRQKLTDEGAANWRPAWTADGRSIVFSSNRRAGASLDAFDIFEMPADGSAPATLLLHHTYGVWEGEISPDGRWLVMRSDEQGNIGHIRGRRLDGDTALVPLVVDSTLSMQIALSRDGRWLAWTGYANGRAEIYVAPFPSMSPIRQVSHEGGTEPRWAHSGRELFYKSGTRFMDVSFTIGPALTVGSTRTLFPVTGYRSARNRQEYDVAPDDRHFVMIRNQPGSSNAVVYAEGWFSELKAKVKR
jgi:serine/threonine-protein kinase